MVTNWKNKKVAVLGLGVEGLSSVRFLIKKGARVTVLDKKTEKELHTICHAEFISASNNLSAEKKILKQVQDDIEPVSAPGYKDIKIIGGKDYLKNLNEFDVIVRSPGVKRNLPEIVAAEKNGAIITSQTKIFFDLCSCPIIGVTGTKGKGTTSTLIYKMLIEQGFDAYLGGNIGKSPLDFLDKLNAQSWVVLELSSFQLQDLTKSPHIAVLLMITSEHLDYHKDTKEYVEAKRNILRFQGEGDFAIMNKDYPVSRESDILAKGKVFEVSRKRELREGCFVKDGKVVVVMGKLIRHSGKRSASRISIVLRDSGQARMTDNDFTNQQSIINVKDILLAGKHNLENVCAAVMVATLVGVSKKNMVKVLKTFKGLEHRLELVGEINGVKYYDDSFSTTPETAIAAIQAFKNPEILILGGSSKGSDFRELGRVIGNAKNIKAIIGIGIEWQKIKSKIKNQKSKIIGINKHLRGGRMDYSEVNPMDMICVESCKNMHEIVKTAVEIARKGDVVLLSPACASFDMFKNYKDRGEQFKIEVEKLKSNL